MTNLPETESNNQLPFAHNKIPVSNGLAEFQAFTEEYPGYTFCPYIADKDDSGWDSSTSRSYMNQVMPGFLYVPVNVTKGDEQGLAEVFEATKVDKRVAAVNITQPHKSSSVVRRIFLGNENSEENIDTLIRNSEGELVPYDLNAPAFVSWFTDEVGSFADKTVVLVGVGGVGEPMAKAISKESPSRLVLIDPNDRTHLAEQLSSQTTVSYHDAVSAVSPAELVAGMVLINAAGKEGATDNSGVASLLQQQKDTGGIFVDIRPHLDIEIVEAAKGMGWQAYTGYGMNARNDYALLKGIADYMNTPPISFADFQALVAAAS